MMTNINQNSKIQSLKEKTSNRFDITCTQLASQSGQKRTTKVESLASQPDNSGKRQIQAGAQSPSVRLLFQSRKIFLLRF